MSNTLLTRRSVLKAAAATAPNGLPCSVQLVAAQYRDDLVLRAARVLELAEPVAVADLG